MVGSRFDKLIDLAREDCAERRRELLREVADLFFQTGGKRSRTADDLFDEVLQSVAETIHEEALVELAHRFAIAADAPRGLSRDLAHRCIAVAAPILKQSTALTDEDLVTIVHTRSQAHIRAAAERAEVSQRVADAIVHVGADTVLDVLLRNPGATFSRASFEEIVERARRSAELRESLVARPDAPLAVLNEIFFLATPPLRRRILERNASEEASGEALPAARRRRIRTNADMSDEMRRASIYVRLKRAEGTLDAKLLIALLRDGQRPRFLCGLAELTGVRIQTVARMLARKDVDALAAICRASEIDCATFAVLAGLISDAEEADCKAFIELYHDIPLESVRRVIRFHRDPKAAESRAAA
jgi:uncharacterized protein (DUF2336 family)